MTQPVGNCPGCGGGEPFEQVHAGLHADDHCPDQDGLGGECTEWVCSGCGAGVFMGTVIFGSTAAMGDTAPATTARRSVRAA